VENKRSGVAEVAGIASTRLAIPPMTLRVSLKELSPAPKLCMFVDGQQRVTSRLGLWDAGTGQDLPGSWFVGKI